MLSVDREKLFRLGPESRLHFHIQPQTSVAYGEFARTGAVDLRLEFTSGAWTEFQGDATATEWSGTISDSQGKSSAIHYNGNGAIISGVK